MRVKIKKPTLSILFPVRVTAVKSVFEGKLSVTHMLPNHLMSPCNILPNFAS